VEIVKFSELFGKNDENVTGNLKLFKSTVAM
jgi:hypothetical protein